MIITGVIILRVSRWVEESILIDESSHGPGSWPAMSSDHGSLAHLWIKIFVTGSISNMQTFKNIWHTMPTNTIFGGGANPFSKAATQALLPTHAEYRWVTGSTKLC